MNLEEQFIKLYGKRPEPMETYGHAIDKCKPWDIAKEAFIKGAKLMQKENNILNAKQLGFERVVEIYKAIHRYQDENSHMNPDLALSWGCQENGVTYEWYCDNMEYWWE